MLLIARVYAKLDIKLEHYENFTIRAVTQKESGT